MNVSKTTKSVILALLCMPQLMVAGRNASSSSNSGWWLGALGKTIFYGGVFAVCYTTTKIHGSLKLFGDSSNGHSADPENAPRIVREGIRDDIRLNKAVTKTILKEKDTELAQDLYQHELIKYYNREARPRILATGLLLAGTGALLLKYGVK